MLPHRHRFSQTTQPAPALIMIHGWKGNENVMWAFESALPANMVVVSPRAPFAVEDGGYGWFVKDDGRTAESVATGLAALDQFITESIAQYPIDQNQIYLMGFSQGAAMSLLYALTHSARVQGVAALAGFLPDGFAVPENCLAGKPLLMMAGTEDDKVPLAQARAAHESLKISGATITYTEYEVGHKLNAQGMRDLKKFLHDLIPSGFAQVQHFNHEDRE